MTSLERALAAIGQREPDRVPLFLLLATYGARELGMPVKEYFSRAENVVEAQLRMRKKYDSDCLYAFFYAGVEAEAFGGSTIFRENAAPNVGAPVVCTKADIESLKAPRVRECEPLCRVLDAISGMKKEAGADVPIVGVAMSPFSLPAMQMGFESYLNLLYSDSEHFRRLMAVNEEFCAEWANAQLEAGATAICFFDPLASPTIIEKETYMRIGYETDKRAIGSINGPVAVHLASGATLPVIDEVVSTGACILGFSCRDDIRAVKEAARGRICLIGNLNGIEMANWDAARAEEEIKKLITGAGEGGGLIISDNHGEIPYSVPEEVILAVSEAARRYGKYPLGVN